MTTSRLGHTALVRTNGGRFAAMLGIDVPAGSSERFKWFLAALLYGAPIPEPRATRTWHEFATRGVLYPKRILNTGWDGLVAILDAGGYVRYDLKTATKLLAVCDALLRDYEGDLDALHLAASGPRDLEARLSRWARVSATRPSRSSCASCGASGARPRRLFPHWRWPRRRNSATCGAAG